MCPYFAVNVGEDCPVFDGLFEFCQLSGGGSVGKLFLFLNTAQTDTLCQDNNHAVIIASSNLLSSVKAGC